MYVKSLSERLLSLRASRSMVRLKASATLHTASYARGASEKGTEKCKGLLLTAVVAVVTAAAAAVAPSGDGDGTVCVCVCSSNYLDIQWGNVYDVYRVHDELIHRLIFCYIWTERKWKTTFGH